MRRIFNLLLIAVLVFFGLFFGTLNDQSVPVDYFFFTLNWPLALSLMGFLLVGVLLGGLFAYLAMWLRMRRRLRTLKRDQANSQQVKSKGEGRVPALIAND